jgi:WD40 repeat protein
VSPGRVQRPPTLGSGGQGTIMLAEEKNAVSVWVAKHISQTIFEEYLAEDYSDDGDRPISRFAEDLGVSFYDHDFVEGISLERPLLVAELIGRLSYGDTFAIEADKAAEAMQLGDQRFNSVVALYGERFQGIWPKDSPLTFLGTFSYQKPEPRSPTLQPGDHSGSIQIARTIASNVVATAGRYGEVRFWDTTNARPIATHSKNSINDFVHALSVSMDGTAMYSCSDEVVRWDLTTNPIESRKMAAHGGYQIGDLALLADQRTVAVACVDNTVGLIDGHTGKEHLLRHDDHVTSVLALPDGKHLVSVTYEYFNESVTSEDIEYAPLETEATFVVWKLQSRKKVQEVKLPLPVTRLLLLPDKSTVLYGTEGGRLVWWDWRDAKPQRVVDAHDDGWVDALELSDDGDLMITAGDKTAKVWHARTGHPIACFDQHTARVKAACFIDKDHGASGSKDATIRVWRISDQEELARFTDVPDDRDEVPSYLDDPWEIHCIVANKRTIVAGETSGRVRILQFDGKKLNLRR